MKIMIALLLAASSFAMGFSYYPYHGSYDSSDNPSTLVAAVSHEGFEIRKDAIGYLIRVHDHYWAFPIPAEIGSPGQPGRKVLSPFVVRHTNGEVFTGSRAYDQLPEFEMSAYCTTGSVVTSDGERGLVFDYNARMVYSSCSTMTGNPPTSFARITYVPKGDYRIVAQQTSNYDWIRIIGFMDEAWFYTPLGLPPLNVAMER